MSANDAGFKAIRDSYAFLLNTNFTHYYSTGSWATPGLAEGVKTPTIDEFLQILPFEAYSRDFLDQVVPSQPQRDLVSGINYDPAYLPGSNAGNTASGAYWVDNALTSVSPTDLINIESSLDSLEQFDLKRLAVMIEFDKLRALANRLRAGLSVGPEATAELLRAGRTMLLRELSRMAINGNGLNNSINGLHVLYDNTFGASGSPNDRQVIQSAVALSGVPSAAQAEELLAEVQVLVRLVSPGEHIGGSGPNVLLTSWRARDLLIRCERILGTTPQFLPDARTGTLRYHLNGVPVYVGPVREDETGLGSTPTFGGTVGKYTSIYALRVGGATGVRMLHYGGESAEMGVQVEDLAEQTGNITRGYRLTGYYTLFVPERQAAARLNKVVVEHQP
jgi:hypothetical protein